MSGEVSIAKAKAEFAALVNRAEKGEQIIVTRNGRPVACLGPLPAKRQCERVPLLTRDRIMTAYGEQAQILRLPEA